MAGVQGTAGNDRLIGEGIADTLYGLEGDDRLEGVGGDDVLLGGSGTNLLDGGAGTDTASYADVTAGVTVSLGVAGPQSTGVSVDTLVSIERLTGSAFADRLTGSDGDDYLNGGYNTLFPVEPSNVPDVVSGGGGNDVIVISGNSNGALLDGGAGDDQITANFSGFSTVRDPVWYPSISTTTAVAGDPVRIIGGAGADQIRAYTSAIIDGGEGDDRITVGLYETTFGQGLDLSRVNITFALTGGAGRDIFALTNLRGTVEIGDFTARDDRLTLERVIVSQIGQRGQDTVLFDGNFAISVVLRNLDARTLTTANISTTSSPAIDLNAIWAIGDVGADVLQGVRVFGGGGDDVLTAAGAGARLVGGAGDDRLVGGGRGDQLDGGAGFDTVDYSGSTASIDNRNDVIVGVEAIIGSALNDVLKSGQSTPVQIDGGAGDDELIGGGGADTLTGGAGRDAMTGGAGADAFVFAPGDSPASAPDTITDFQSGVDVLRLEALGAGQVSIAPGAGGVSRVTFTPADGGAATVVLVSGAVTAGDLRLAAGAYAVQRGTAGDDVLTGGSGPDQLEGLAGNDVLRGGAGDDLLLPGLGADRMFGEDGDDTVVIDQAYQPNPFPVTGEISGGAGADTVRVDTGQRVRLSGATLYVELQAFSLSGIERLVITRPGVLDGLASGPIAVFTSPDQDLVIVSGSSLLFTGAGRDTVVLQGGVSTVDLGDGDDMITDSRTGPAAAQGRIDGGAGVDTLTTADGVSVDLAAGVATRVVNGAVVVQDVLAGIENVTLRFTGAGGTARGDAGANQLIVAQGTLGATLEGRGGDDRLQGGFGDDRLDGGDGADVLSGGPGGADTLLGGAGDDMIYGEGGDDWIVGGAGSDTLTGGGGGRDTFAFGAGDVAGFGPDTILDFETGQDRIDLSGYAGLTDVTLRGVGELFRLTGRDPASGALVLDVAIRGRVAAADIVGAPGGVTVVGQAAGVRLVGTEGGDALTGGAEDDELLGRGGPDDLTGLQGNDRLLGGDGDDVLQGDDASLSTPDGNDVLYGGAGRDTLIGGRGDDQLFGEDGDDVLVHYVANARPAFEGGGLYDQLAGQVNGADQMDGGAGYDFARWGFDALSGAVRLDIGTPGQSNPITVDGAAAGSIKDVEAVYVVGALGGDVLGGGAYDDLLYGIDGDDVLVGRGGADLVSGGDGNDRLQGGRGDDTVLGAGGDDLLDGGEGEDQAGFFETGTVDLRIAGPQDTGSGRDTLVGIENLYGAAGSQTLIGDDRPNQLRDLTSGDDALYGQGGDDVLSISRQGPTGASTVVLDGGEGRDELSFGGFVSATNLNRNLDDVTAFGGAGDDRISVFGVRRAVIDAGAGNDTVRIDVAGGAWRITLGDGTDVLTFADRGDRSYFGGAITGRELVVTDFRAGSGGDRLDLGALSARYFNMRPLEQLIAEGRVQLRQEGANTVVYLDTDGPGGFAPETLLTLLNVDRALLTTDNFGPRPIPALDAGGVLTGTQENDFILRGAGDDVVTGLGGADEIYGGGGADVLFGDGQDAAGPRGDDRLEGGDGADVLVGGRGADFLTGGAGDDILIGGVGVRGGGAPDAFGVTVFDVDGGTDVIDGGDGVDRAYLNFRDREAAVVFALDTGFIRVGEVSGGSVVNVESVQVTGGVAADRLTGGALSDALLGGDGDDVLDGGAGDDVLTGGEGADTLTGGAGADRFVFRRGGATDRIADFETGVDKIVLPDDQQVTSRLRVDVSGGTSIISFDGSQIQVNGAVRPGDLISNGQPIPFFTTGTQNDDTFVGTAAADRYIGLRGDDTISGGAGDDELFGDDTNIHFTLIPGNDVLSGGDGSDKLYGGGGRDIMDGGTGDDYLEFSGHGDIITGGSGSDIFLAWTYASGVDATITDFESGIDELGINVPMKSATLTRLGASDYKLAIIGSYPTGLRSSIEVPINIHFTREVQPADIRLTPLQPVGGAVTVFGLDASGDRIVGGDLAGVFYGLGGDDELIAPTRGSTLYGDRGADRLVGGAGVDVFAYRSELDSGADGGAFDTIVGFEPGKDTIDISAIGGLTAISINRTADGRSMIYASGAAGQLQLEVGASLQRSDLVLGRTDIAVDVVGTGANEIIVGGDEPNRLFGFGGGDALFGNGGDDILVGDGGADSLTGGAGADRFAYRNAADSNAQTGLDIIQDFAGGQDKLDFFLLDGTTAIALARVNNGDTLVYANTPNGQVVVGVRGPLQGSDVLAPATNLGLGLDLVGQARSEVIIGSGNADRLFGLAGDDSIIGGGGDDLIYGDLGRDLLTGGAGADRFAFRDLGDSPITGMDAITDFQGGVDKLDFTFFGARGVARTGVGYKDGDAFVYVDVNGDGVTDFGVALRGVTSFNLGDILL